jgi:serine/threonine protein kinase
MPSVMLAKMTVRGATPDPPDASGISSEPAAAAETDPFVGKVLGERYRVIERLAVGGMGTVYRAEHLGLHKEVAIKLVNDGPDARSDHALRFLREAMLTSRIDHPNVISATDYGTFEDGTAFLAMTLVNGPTLSSVMEAERPMRWRRAAEIGSQIADAVAAAQEQGIVHRDLKPENLVLQPMLDGSEVVKVLDFGIAKYARDSLAPPPVQRAQQATRVGVVVGTPGYMAPEQAVGMRADHRADLYSIGVVLWECVAGRKLWPYQGDMQKLLAAQLNRRPPALRSACTDATIPAAFEDLVAALLATRPEDRPGSATAVRDALRGLVREPDGEGPTEPAAVPIRLVVTPPRPGVETRAVAVVDFRKRAAEPEEKDELNTEPPSGWTASTTMSELLALGPETPQAPGSEPAWPELAPSAVEVLQQAPASEPSPRPGRRVVWWVAAGVFGLAAIGALITARTPSSQHVVARPMRATRPAAAALPSAARAPAPGLPAPAPAPAPGLSPPTVTPLPAEPNPSTRAEGAPSDPQPHEAQDASAKKPRTAVLAEAPAGPPDETADQLRARARGYFTSGDFRNAGSAYKLATKRSPEHAGAHAGLGASLLALGDAKAAITAYRRAIQLEPGSSGFHAALGRAYLVSGDRPRAIDAYRKAVALDPNNQTAFAALAQLAP